MAETPNRKGKDKEPLTPVSALPPAKKRKLPASFFGPRPKDDAGSPSSSRRATTPEITLAERAQYSLHDMTDSETDEEIVAWRKSRPPPQGTHADDIPDFASRWVQRAKINGVPMDDVEYRKLERHLARIVKKKAVAKASMERALAKADEAKEKFEQLDGFVDATQAAVDRQKQLLRERYGPSVK